MTAMHIVIDVLLAITAVACWLGVVGMWRMREPIQALNYMSLPAALGSVTLTVAVACQTGASQATAKCIAIAVILIAINSIVTHATARAFRVRQIGHWEPRLSDDVEFLEAKRK
ncbi:MAG: monovalent cation/H(+) antiporter subunit G [Acidobacteriaceae bacterium]